MYLVVSVAIVVWYLLSYPLAIYIERQLPNRAFYAPIKGFYRPARWFGSKSVLLRGIWVWEWETLYESLEGPGGMHPFLD